MTVLVSRLRNVLWKAIVGGLRGTFSRQGRRDFGREFVKLRKKPTSAKERVMNSSWIRKALLFSVITGAGLAIGCGGGVEGKYRDPSGGINVEFKGGKAYIALGAYAVDGTYKVEGNKIIARGDFGMMIHSPLVFTVNSDGTIDGPRDSMIPRLEKVK
jgi:hypothetical protein